MKQILLFIVVVFIGFQSYAQNDDDLKNSIIKLMEVKNNSNFFTELVDLNIHHIKKDKQHSFRNQIAELAENKKAEAIAYFIKRYTKKDIDAIYKDYSSLNSLAYSQKTNSFLKEWQSYKNQFQKEFKKVFATY